MTATGTRSATATATASGARVTFGPVPMGQTWDVLSVTVSAVLAGASMPSARTYRNSVQPPHMIDGTYTGAQDVSTIAEQLHPGDSLIVEWTGGNVGDSCTARLAYTYASAGQR